MLARARRISASMMGHERSYLDTVTLAGLAHNVPSNLALHTVCFEGPNFQPVLKTHSRFYTEILTCRKVAY